MNLEDLNKTQLLLLTVLVNFVTSIAVGVLTVSLLDQAPPTITQTVNRIVDHTVETIASTTPLGLLPQKETTVVIHDEDLLTAALAADLSRTVSIYAGKSTTTQALAVGTYLPKSKAVVTATNTVLPREVIIVFSDGSYAPASVSRTGATLTIYGFADAAHLPKVAVPLLIAKSDLRQGQTVLGIGENGGAGTGIISRVSEDGIHTNLSGIPVGAAGVNSSGNIIGIAIDSLGTFATADKISALLTATSSPAK